MGQRFAQRRCRVKVLLASSSSGSRGGGELYLLYLARALRALGHDVSLWTSSHSRMDELAQSFAAIGTVLRSEYRNTYDRPMRSLGSYFDRRSASRIAAEWRQLRPDVIHINKQNLEDGLDLLHAAAIAKVPHVCTIHLTQTARFLRASFASLRDFVAKRALRGSRSPLVAVLEERRRDLQRFLGPSERVRLVSNGVPSFNLGERAAQRETKRVELGVEHGALLAVAVGRMVPQKRPLLFLETAQRVHSELPRARFLWIGDGELAAEWDRGVESRGLGQIVRRLPWQTDVASYLFAADVFLHTAEFEGLPLAILEAMSAELPCAITENLARELPFLDASNSICIQTDNGWCGILKDRAELARRGHAARLLVEQRFSFEKMAQEYEALYQETTGRRA